MVCCLNFFVKSLNRIKDFISHIQTVYCMYDGPTIKYKLYYNNFLQHIVCNKNILSVHICLVIIVSFYKILSHLFCTQHLELRQGNIILIRIKIIESSMRPSSKTLFVYMKPYKRKANTRIYNYPTLYKNLDVVFNLVINNLKTIHRGSSKIKPTKVKMLYSSM